MTERFFAILTKIWGGNVIYETPFFRVENKSKDHKMHILKFHKLVNVIVKIIREKHLNGKLILLFNKPNLSKDT